MCPEPGNSRVAVNPAAAVRGGVAIVRTAVVVYELLELTDPGRSRVVVPLTVAGMRGGVSIASRTRRP